MDNKIINKFLKFIEKDATTNIKKDFKWLGKAITKDLEKLTKEKKSSKKKWMNLYKNTIKIESVFVGRLNILNL